MDRLIYGDHKELYELIKEPLESMGYDIIRITLTNLGKNAKIRSNLQIMIERIDGTLINVDDCEKVSHLVSAILDVEDIIKKTYNLEVSSGGIDQPLTRYKDFQKAKGHIVKFSFITPIDNARNMEALLTDIDQNGVKIHWMKKEYFAQFDNIQKAKFVLTDELINMYDKNLGE